MSHVSFQDAYNLLASYTLTHPDPVFIHQHVVDAYAAQYADSKTKPIKITFALIGLCLYLEHGFTGKQVQLAHMKLGRFKKAWPIFSIPSNMGKVSISDVLEAPEGAARDAMIHTWSASVWSAWKDGHDAVRTIVKNELGVE